MRRLGHSRGAIGSLLVSTFLVLSCSTRQRLPDAPPIDVTPAAHDAAKDPGPVRVELLRVRYRIHRDGTYERTFHRRYRVLDSRGVQGWGYAYAWWNPWYMNKPSIEATVATGDSPPRRLDPATLAEQPAYPDAPDIYGDARVLKGPLPSIAVGSVVDETIETTTHRDFFARGFTEHLTLQSEVGREKVELIVEAPPDTPVKFEVRGAKVTQRKESHGDVSRYLVEGGPFPAIEPPEPLLPPEVAAYPFVAFSTGRSWQQVAARYAKRVDDRLEEIDFGPRVAEITNPDDEPRAKIADIVGWIKQRIRYASIAFGETGIIPRSPISTVSNGYGDCKDQATLLVGLLRAAGFDAKVALLRSGPGADVLPSLPTLDVFDHAIVVVPDLDPPLWIDPTADYRRVGTLPIGDQNRLALVVDTGTTALVRTPAPTPATNTYREVRDVELLDYGRADVVELSTGTGWHEWQLRDTFAAPRPNVVEQLERYVKGAYGAETVARLEYSPATDLTAPFSVTLEAAATNVGYTDLFTASVATSHGPLLSWLPDALTDKTDDKRKNDLMLPVPYRAEVTWRVHIPEDFVVASTPNDTTTAIGPGRIEQSTRKGPDSVIEVQHRIDVGKARFSPAETERFRKDLQSYLAHPRATVSLKHRARDRIDAGKLQEGIELLRARASEQPRAMLPRMRFARAVSDLGFGDIGRREAREAAALEPESATAQKELAHLLARGDLGRDLSGGFDREGAIAAYRKAAELDEDDFYSQVRVAVLLENDDDGNRYGNPELERACAYYDTLDRNELRQFDEGQFAFNAEWCLLHAERFDEVLRRLRALPNESVPSSLAVMAAAAGSGPDSALSEVTRLGLSGRARTAALDQAARLLARRREYASAARLLRAAYADGSDAARVLQQARQWAKLRKVDPSTLEADTPEGVIKKLIGTYMAEPKRGPDLAKKLLTDRAWTDDGESDVADVLEKWDVSETKPFEMPLAVFGDMVVGGFDATHEGSDRLGYRVRASIDMGQGPHRFQVFVVRERGAYKVRAFGDHVPELGAEALYAVDQGRTKLAKQWLSWARELWHTGRGVDPLRQGAFVPLWNDGKGDVRLAAAALTTASIHAADALPVLERALRSETDDAKRTAIQYALVRAHQKLEHWGEAARLARGLLSRHPKSDVARNFTLEALLHLKRFDERARLIEEAIEQHPDRRHAWLHELARGESWRGRFERARSIRQEIIDDGKATATTLNTQAWEGIFVGVTDRDAELAARAVQMSKGRELGVLHTLATVYAELGRLGEAHQTLQTLLAKREKGRPVSVDHYVIGRIAEQLGLIDAARAAYSRVDEPDHNLPSTTYRLAQQRLAKLPQ